MEKRQDYLQMIAGESVSRRPVWFMRQAGRSQATYRKIKERYSLFEITHQPELCAKVTALPVHEYDVDAAILYKDIMTPLVPMGVDVNIKSGIGYFQSYSVERRCGSATRYCSRRIIGFYGENDPNVDTRHAHSSIDWLCRGSFHIS